MTNQRVYTIRLIQCNNVLLFNIYVCINKIGQNKSYPSPCSATENGDSSKNVIVTVSSGKETDLRRESFLTVLSKHFGHTTFFSFIDLYILS